MAFFCRKIEKNSQFWHVWVHNLPAVCSISHMLILYEGTHPHLRPNVFELSISVFLMKIMDFFCWKIEKNNQFWHVWVLNLEAICLISHVMILCESTHSHLHAHVFELSISVLLMKIMDLFCWKIKKNPQFWHIWVHNFNIVHEVRHMMVLYASRHPQLHAYVFFDTLIFNKNIGLFLLKNQEKTQVLKSLGS